MTKNKNDVEITETKQCNFVTDWMKDVNIRTYKTMVFEPCKVLPKDQFNLWDGWKASKLPPTKLKFENSLIYKHLSFIFGEETVEFEHD